MNQAVNEAIIRIPRRALVYVLVVLLVGAAFVALLMSGVLASAGETRLVADQASLNVQRATAERGVERAFEQSTDQVKKARALKLAITAQQADAIATKALADLKTLRHSAFVSLGQAFGVSGDDAEKYATAMEQRYEAKPASAEPTPSPLLLAPRLYQIVQRMDDLATQISDKATNDLVAPPSTPSPSARPTPTPTR